MTAEHFRDFANYVLVTGLVLAALGTGAVNLFRGRVERERDAAARAKDQQRLEKERDLNGKIEELLRGNTALQERLTPFEELARERYPRSEPAEALHQLERDLAAVEARTAELEAKARPRAVIKAARSNVLMTLAPFVGSRVRLSAPSGDAEAFAYASQIVSLLHDAGIDAGPIDAVVSTVPVRENVLHVASDAPGSLGAALLTSLHLAGVEVSAQGGSARAGTAHAYLEVGSKP